MADALLVSGRAIAFGAALGVAVAACAGLGSAPAPPDESYLAKGGSASPAEGESETSRAVRPPDGAGRLGAFVEEVLMEVSRRRGLPVRHPVPLDVKGPEELVAVVRDIVHREVPEAAVRGQEDWLVALGVVPAGFDYLEAVFELMRTDLAGLYDTRNKRMVLARRLAGDEASSTLAHELVHALQDQHFDLARGMRYQPDAGDRQSALQALAEGDATSAMIDFSLQGRGTNALALPDDELVASLEAGLAPGAAGGKVPGVVRRSLVMPYVDGVRFVHFLRRRGGWTTVNAAWRRPPASTEQVLHPEKYLAQEAPLSLPALPAELQGYRLQYHDVFGEQSLRIVFREWLPAAAAARAAADWGGDRAGVYGRGARRMGVWHLRFDDRRAARRASAAFGRRAGESSRKDAGRLCRERDGRGAFVVARSGTDVVVVAGPVRQGDAAAEGAPACPEALKWAERLLER